MVYNGSMVEIKPSESPDEPAPSDPLLSVAAVGIVLAVVGWAGLIGLIANTLPSVPNRWLFFGLVYLALTGAALPIVRLFHRRFDRPTSPPVGPVVLIRQASWVGLVAILCLWLQISRLLSLPLALIVLVGAGAIELFLRLRERTQWRP